MTQVATTPVAPGQPAPEFAVPAVHGDRMISLADYRGAPLLLGLFPGLYCPFCRRAIAQMAATSDKLKPLGVECLAVVGTELDNARLYFKFRPMRLPLGADPHLATHRSYGVPRPQPTAELMQIIETVRINPSGELPEPAGSGRCRRARRAGWFSEDRNRSAGGRIDVHADEGTVSD